MPNENKINEILCKFACPDDSERTFCKLECDSHKEAKQQLGELEKDKCAKCSFCIKEASKMTNEASNF